MPVQSSSGEAAKAEGLPYAEEAERGVVACILLKPEASLELCRREKVTHDSFLDSKCRIIWEAALELEDQFATVDVGSLGQYLGSRGLLPSVGGIGGLVELQDSIPSAANLLFYLEHLREAQFKRWMLRVVYGEHFAPEQFFEAVSNLVATLNAHPVVGAPHENPAQLMDYDTSQDANALIGISGGKLTRYLCRTHGAWLIGPSGVGKSSLMLQFAYGWALGRDVFGVAPVTPQRVLIVQAENDRGDLSEATQGVLEGLGLSRNAEALAALAERVRIVTERRKTGKEWCKALQAEIAAHRADIVFCDPLASFGGIDFNRQDQVTQFLRHYLDPVLVATGAAMVGIHHTGKPRDSKGQRAMTEIDHAYSGLGSSELLNWARACVVLIPKDEASRTFLLKFTKRGGRAGARHPDGTPTREVWLRHGLQGIHWDQIEPPAEPEPSPESNSEHRGRSTSKVDELLQLGLGLVIDNLKEPQSVSEVAERIRAHARRNRLDPSLSTCKRAVAQLLKNGAVILTDAGYSKP